ncbi:NAD(P)-dependent oxidoreductase [Actinophytocola oryzae]|uniref:3-hydroxyisobutyrate dehydrogenase n=1 Tax=Actinophytocola oryzae TaxID=502181 RepID=A0A4R7VUD4_9PSEU|nr:NAD(P)-dependent oxidoreductase [Actinophytocola oryzae]TDV53566.1 3-hydroxyisobutyrate dehydrogenase [Actinophytocola oryzae]
MTKVALLGTGLMGAGMGRSMARAGLDLTVWNRSPDKARAVGVPVADDPASAVRDADVVVTMLFGFESVAQVMTEALPAMRPDAVWLQTTTVGLEETTRLAELCAKHGVSFVDAPVSGTRQPAESGELTVLAAGRPDERLTPVLDAISAKVVWVGERPGDGHRLKLVSNAWVLSVVAGTAQSVALSQALGIDPKLFLDLIAGGPLDSGYAQAKARAMLKGDFTPAFALGGAAKDALLIQEAAAESGVDTTLVAAMARLFGSAGDPEDDMAAVIRALRP